MIQKNNENSPKNDSSQLLEEEETAEGPKFKFLYRNKFSPKRDKCSGVSSDEETTSSSLVPIPDTLKQIKNKSRWTINETGGSPDFDISYGGEILGKSSEDIVRSLEELRKKYTLKNESSVAFKMNSANMMLDDILSSANLKKISNESLQYKSFKEQEFRPKVFTENESSTTESSVNDIHHCPHILNHTHLSTPIDFLPPPNNLHCSAVQPLHSSPSSTIKETNTINNQKKKSFLEKFYDLQIKYRIQSVYKTFQKSKNRFAKTRDTNDLNVQQGIPGADYQQNLLNQNEPLSRRFEHSKYPLSQYPKKMVLDLVEFGENSQSESKYSEDFQCTCKNQNERCQCTNIKQRECNCPEIVPKCVCVECNNTTSELTSETTKPNSFCAESSSRSTEPTQPLTSGLIKKGNNTSLPLDENKNEGQQKTNSLLKNSQGWKKYCSRERNYIERTDIYYFDHGNSAYYQTTDNHPMRYTECLVERTDEYATRFWAEIFGTIEVGIAFLISFILQLYRFLFTSIIRSLTVGLLQIFSDYFFKPFLTILFNGVLQPCLILAYNIAISVRDLCLPISQTFGFFIKEVASILKSCRFVEVSNRQSSCYCGNKV